VLFSKSKIDHPLSIFVFLNLNWDFIVPASPEHHIVFLDAAASMFRLFSNLFCETLLSDHGALEWIAQIFRASSETGSDKVKFSA
jgi:hypothetical protein